MEVFKTVAAENSFLHIFMVGRKGESVSPEELAATLCHPSNGLHADGLVIAEAGEKGEFSFSIWNRDGSAAEISGNGMAGLAAVVFSQGSAAGEIVLNTSVGRRIVRLRKNEFPFFSLQVEIGTPDFTSRDFFPFLQKNLETYSFRGNDFHPVSTGNPHCVVLLKQEMPEHWLLEEGAKLENSEMFPHRTNVEFVWKLESSRCQAFFYERGVGPTGSSSTGSAAIYAVLRRLNLAGDSLLIEVPGGEVELFWENGIWVNNRTRLLWKGDYFPAPIAAG